MYNPKIILVDKSNNSREVIILISFMLFYLMMPVTQRNVCAPLTNAKPPNRPAQPHTGKLFQSPTAKASAYALYVRLSWALFQTQGYG